MRSSLYLIIAAAVLLLALHIPPVPQHHTVLAAPPVLCIVWVTDHQFLTGIGGANGQANTKMFTWIRDNTASTFGCTLLGVIGEGDQMNIVCGPVSSTVEDQLVFNNWNILGTAGIKWMISAGNHEYNNAAQGTRTIANLSENMKDSPTTPCGTIPTPGQLSPAAFIARGLGFTSPSQFWAMGGVSGVNQNSYIRFTPTGYHGIMVMSLNFFATQGELDAGAIPIAANTTDDVITVTHAAMKPTDNTNHIAAYLDYGCSGSFCNNFYSLDATNSRSGLAMQTWIRAFPNVVGMVSGHYFPGSLVDAHWSKLTDTSTSDGHSQFGMMADFQYLDQNPTNSAGTSVAITSQTGGSGTCPQVGSTGCNAEVAFIMPMVIDTGAKTAKFYALSTNTGHWVASGNGLPQPGNTMLPIATFTYPGTSQGLFPMPSAINH